MPFYNYKCVDGCKMRFEAYFPMSEVKSEIKCKYCENRAVRIFSMPRVIVKNWQPGLNAEEDFERSCDYYEHRYYSIDQQKQSLNKKANISEV